MLKQPVKSLSSSSYYDPKAFERERVNVFSREWICIGRASDWDRAGSYRRLDIAGQQIIVVRQRDASLRAFFNTCRHRGSALCEAESGRFPAGRIVCPYHAWAYGLDGHLLKTSPLPDGFELDLERLSLYPVSLEDWGGFVFINLSDTPRSALPESIDDARLLDNWRLDTLALAHRETHRLSCNWKVFWENFLECLHCPGVHVDLCRLVPHYGKGVVSRDDLPADDPLLDAPTLRPGASTWTSDGQPVLPPFPGLTKEEHDAGMTFVTSIPSIFVVGHVDYVRSVRVLPVAPECTDITIDWLVQPGALASGDLDLEALTGFGRQVVLEDGRVCELNQQGLRNTAHQFGTLMPQEYDIASFHDWLKTRLE